jgi:SAM-dependent methyltransferase
VGAKMPGVPIKNLHKYIKKFSFVFRSDIVPPKKPLFVTRIENYAEYLKYIQRQNSVYLKRTYIEQKCIGYGSKFTTSAYCYTCGTVRSLVTNYAYSFTTENGQKIPNWREHLLCEHCMLNNRMRAAIHIFEQECKIMNFSNMYLTEYKTPLFKWIKKYYPNTQGSEYLGNHIPYGTYDKYGTRNETLTDLTWEDQKFDFILSFDVFEHIPNYLIAFKECARVLKPHGKLLFTVPFILNNKNNVMRAKYSKDNKIEHLLPPEYHGDPLNQNGCLAFYHFGWDLLDEIRECGFSHVYALFYWSKTFGYLGVDQFAFIAEKN